jgi:ABC-type uncharacterized transport system permease subunit
MQLSRKINYTVLPQEFGVASTFRGFEFKLVFPYTSRSPTPRFPLSAYTCHTSLCFEFNGYFCMSSAMYEGVSKSFQTGHLERELQMVQLFATRRSFIAIL